MVGSSMINDLLLGQILYDILDRVGADKPIIVGYAQTSKEVHPKGGIMVLVEPGRYNSKWFGLGGQRVETEYTGWIYVLGEDRKKVFEIVDIVEESIRRLLDNSWLGITREVTLEDVKRVDDWGARVFLAKTTETPPRGLVRYSTPEGEATAFNVGCVETLGYCVFVEGVDMNILLAEPMGGEDLEQEYKLYPGYRLRYRIRFVEVVSDVDVVTGGGGVGEGAVRFTELLDTPSSYSGHAGKLVVVNSTENGLVFQRIEDVLPSDLDDKTVKVSSDDTSPNYLENKIVAGSNITITTLNNGADEQLQISADVDVVDEKVKVNSDDTSSGYLSDKLEAGGHIRLNEIVYLGSGTKLQISAEPWKFTELLDTPNAYSGEGGKIVAVKETEDGLEFINREDVGLPAGSDQYVQFNRGGAFGGDSHFKYDYENYVLTLDTAGYGPLIRSYSTETDYTHEWWVSDGLLYRVDDGTGWKSLFNIRDGKVELLEGLVNIVDPGIIEIVEISSPPTGEAGKGKLFVDSTDHHIKFVASDGTVYDLTEGTGGGGATTFVELTDTPSSYSGYGGKYVAVKSSEDGLEFVDPPSGSSPAGPDGSVQYNVGGVLGGDSNLVWDKDNKLLDVRGNLNVERLNFYEAQDASTNKIIGYIGERPAGNNRIMFFIEPDGSNQAGLVISPTTTSPAMVNIGLWADNIDAGGSSVYAGIAQDSNGVLMFYNRSSDIIFKPAMKEVLKLTSSEKVGIKNGSPSELLSVGTSGDGSKAIANEWALYSDRRIKTDIEEYKGGLEAVEKLVPRRFRYIRDPKKRKRLGLIAQEVIGVVPEAVSRSGGLLALDYNALIPILISAIKELKQKVESLEAKLGECSGSP